MKPARSQNRRHKSASTDSSRIEVDQPAAKLSDADPVQTGRILALRRLGRLPQTEHDLRSYLLRKGIPVEIADELVAELRESGLLNDLEYAQMWTRSRRQLRRAASSVIRFELVRKGVDRETIDSAFQNEPVDETELAVDLAERKWNLLSQLDLEIRSRRVVGLLVRRGHSATLAYAIVRKLRDAESSASAS